MRKLPLLVALLSVTGSFSIAACSTERPDFGESNNTGGGMGKPGGDGSMGGTEGDGDGNGGKSSGGATGDGDGSGGSQSGSGGVAQPGLCGDGAFGAGETCDDGNTETETACPYGQATCVRCNAECSEVLNLEGPICGDDTVSDGEACDEGASWCQSCAVAPMIAAGGNSTCVLLTEGRVKCWGDGLQGQLGNGSFDDQLTPVTVTTLGIDVIALDQGALHTCALLRGGDVMCWGDNNHGALGDGTNEDRLSPVKVISLSGKAIAVSSGGASSCALLADGTVECWGNGYWGQLGNGANDQQKQPVAVVGLTGKAVTISLGAFHACALLEDSSIACWGADGTERGNPNTAEVFEPAGRARAISSGRLHTCIITNAGMVECWGNGEYGRLGNGSMADSSTPVEVSGLGQTAIAIASGEGHSCALLEGNQVKCWGLGMYGSLGDGETEDQSVPVTVTGLKGLPVAITAGAYHSCALLDDATINCWGAGTDGQLGDGNLLTQGTPVEVIGIP